MNDHPLHIVFSLSASASLREALKQIEWPDEVIGLSDDWCLGQIAEIDTVSRLRFVEESLGYELHEDQDQIETFWHRSLISSRPRIVWFSEWSTKEYCGFLEWLRRNEGAPFQLVDLTDTLLPALADARQKLPVQCVSTLTTENFIRHQLWSLAVSPDEAKLRRWTNLWQRLRQENAPLRVMTPDGLMSASMDYFDNQLLKFVGSRWRRAVLIVGHMLGAMMFDSFRKGGVYQCGDLIFFTRLRVLVETGVLESKGDMSSFEFEVRRAN
ncbi:DUF3658 domain-containing protein [Asticcacaulis sp. YBE204]|uniref:DUF3658 domain-containing protein n=1 Tax=Asticcacaulis sp. YBE204 TaxID=1282363 RepID=UPI0003C40039|nr:DUF3658 domain-containing protein [Asticcacaulis sp. YBE204]ESQ78106.1 hypothetical protein AEYBE204_14780 [Asticcacaulis sp. YBE204]